MALYLYNTPTEIRNLEASAMQRPGLICVLLIACVTISTVPAASVAASARQWKKVDRQELEKSWTWPKRQLIPGYGLTVSADFDGDGRLDRADLVEDSTSGEAGIEIWLSKKNTHTVMPIGEASFVSAYSIDVANPGVFGVSCRSEYLAGDCPEPVDIGSYGIILDRMNAGQEIIYYDGSEMISDDLE